MYENTPAELQQCFEPHGLSPSYDSSCNFPLAFFWGIHPCEELLCDMTLCDMTLFSVWNYLGFCICLSQWTLCLQRSLKRPLCISIICKKNNYLVCSFSFPSTCQFSGNATCYSSEKNQVIGWKTVFWLLTVSRYKVTGLLGLILTFFGQNWFNWSWDLGLFSFVMRWKHRYQTAAF